jgi:hypothetical protein
VQLSDPARFDGDQGRRDRLAILKLVLSATERPLLVQRVVDSEVHRLLLNATAADRPPGPRLFLKIQRLLGNAAERFLGTPKSSGQHVGRRTLSSRSEQRVAPDCLPLSKAM